MSIQPVNVNPLPLAYPAQTRSHATDATGSARGNAPGAAPSTHARAASAASRTADVVPADAPAGTDPMLWSVLTSEERSFFARARAMGHVTYGPGTRTAPAGVPLGGRVDLRV
jgi:hypothetical protein